eukprot:6340154-Prymnesium_polylepis.1
MGVIRGRWCTFFWSPCALNRAAAGAAPSLAGTPRNRKGKKAEEDGAASPKPKPSPSPRPKSAGKKGKADENKKANG